MKTVTLAVVGLGIAAIASSANAEFILTLRQVGPDVVSTGTGSINTAGLTFFDGGGDTAGLEPNLADAGGGPPTFAQADVYDGFTGPTTFGPGGITFPTSGSGDSVSIVGAGQLYLPTGYVSGTALSDTDTYASQTFATLGFTPGTYTYSFGSGVNADSFVVTALVPEPASLGLLAFGGLTLLQRRRRGDAASLA